MNKLGFHVNQVSEDVYRAIVKVRPPLIKTLSHDVGFWRRIREAFPEAFVVGRLYEEHQPYTPDPEALGRAYADRIIAQEANRHHLIDAWETPNECLSPGNDPTLYEAYDAYQAAFAGRLHSAGLETVAMNFGTGQYTGEEWLRLFPRTLEACKYLGFHEYDWPDMWRLHQEGIKAGNGGMWLALRYRRIMGPLRQRFGNKHVALITECGVTQAVYPGRPDVGWRTELSEERYWQSLKWYNDEIVKDDYVRGAAVFVVGALPPFHSFETLGDLVNRIATLSPQPGQYRSHYVLFPQGTPWSWYDASRHYFLRFRATRGESADDAAKVHGSLGHTITCINATAEAQAQLKRLNPDATLDLIKVASPAELFEVMKWRADNNRRFG